VVEISGFDYSACGGTHCRRTGEIGLLKIVKADKIRGNLRFEFLCGGRALRDYSLKHRAVQEISRRFSVREKDAAAAVERALDEAGRARKKMKRLQEELAGYEAREMTGNETGGIVRQAWTDKSAEEARLLALNIVRKGAWVVLFAALGDRQNHLVFASSEKVPVSMRELMSDVLSRVAGRGGGGPSLAEAVVEKAADLEAVLEAAESWVRARVS
jgi:alanyl-tRNA synthetase